MVNKTKITAFEMAQMIPDLWNPLTQEQRSMLIDKITIQRYRKNHIIYQIDEKPIYLMCIIQGKVKIYVEGVGGRSQIVRMLSAKGMFGYRAAFANENYKTTASAFETSTICLIPINIIKQFIKENSNLAIAFIKRLSVDLGVADVRTVSLTQKHLRGRIAESLISLKDNYGVEEDGSTLSIYLSREDLANLSNMTTSNAIRTLSSFANENLIAIDGRKIKLINEEEIRNISQNG